MKKMFFVKLALLIMPILFYANLAFSQLGDNACAGAHLVVPGNTSDVTFFGNTSNGAIVPACSPSIGTAAGDVWLRFVAVQTTQTVTVFDVGSDFTATGGVGFQVLSGACGSNALLGCSKNSLTVSSLTVGSTYFVRLFSFATNQTGWTNDARSQVRIAVTPSAAVLQPAVANTKELFSKTTISAPNAINNPWEITLGPDNNLWVTESKGYRLFKISPVTGKRDTVLDVSQGSTFLPMAQAAVFNAQFNINGSGTGAQGGFAGLALHPDFLASSNPKNFVYLGYIYQFISANDPNGTFFKNMVARFTFNPTTNKLESPVIICDTLPGSNDHNSQRMIIAPVVTGGTPYLFYASGDVGSGQFSNRLRPLNAQNLRSYEGKILRFNLEPDEDTSTPSIYDDWIPSTGASTVTTNNPFNATLGVQSAVYTSGMRNNQGFAYDPTLNILYGSSHGPYSDDEVNIISRAANHGHPLVAGYAADGNYNGIGVGASNGQATSAPIIANEATNAAGLTNYRDPIFSTYPGTTGQINANPTGLWYTPGSNADWPSEGLSGMGLYTSNVIPGWRNSLINAGLKWGRLIRLKLNAAGTGVLPIGAADTASYFQSTNRYRDIAIDPNGRDLFIISDKNSASSGPSTGSTQVQACPGCIEKFTFLGYPSDASGRSRLATSTRVSTGTNNACNTGVGVTINGLNNNIWVPISGQDGNVIAEINAMGNNLGNVTASYYQRTGTIRRKLGFSYMNRSITINVQNQPAVGTPVRVRFYFTQAEFNELDAATNSGVTSVSDLKVIKNSDACLPNLIDVNTNNITPNVAEAFGTNNAYVLQVNNIASFSSFYFGATSTTVLPLDIVSFDANKSVNSVAVNFTTANEQDVAQILIERSTDNGTFVPVGSVAPQNKIDRNLYSFTDVAAQLFANGSIQYRLKIVDATGKVTYSNVITLDANGTKPTVTVFPNPAINKATITFTANTSDDAVIKLIDASGKVVYNERIVANAGVNVKNIDISQLSAGNYVIQVIGNTVNTKTKFIKQ